MAKNIPTDLLRSFVTVVDLGGFTRAAEALGRTQPAISLQIRRLEELLNTKLIRTAGRQFALTDEAIALGPYARQLLRLNDDIVAHFADAALSGWIRVGVPTDFAHSFLLEAIAGFVTRHPDVRIEIESMLSRDLREALTNDRLDMTVAIATENDPPYLVESATEITGEDVTDTVHNLTPAVVARDADPRRRHDRPFDQLAHRRFARRELREDGASGRVGEGSEGGVERGHAVLMTYSLYN